MNFDFTKGGEEWGTYYPPLKPLDKAIVFHNGSYYHYEPGNGTRYEVLFTKFDTKYQKGVVVMSVICPRNAAMIIPDEMGMHSLGYMQEKLKMLEGDCYALIPLVNQYLKEHK